MAFLKPPIVEVQQDTPNLVYKIICEYTDYDPANPDIFVFDLPFQLGTTQTAVGAYTTQPPDPDEVWGVIRWEDLDQPVLPAPLNLINAVLSPLIQIADNGSPAPDTIRQAYCLCTVNSFSATPLTGYYAVEYYLKWYKQAEGGTQTFGLTPTP